MEVQVVVENTSLTSKIKGKHGLSLLINIDGNSILYDFGPRNSLIGNSNYLSAELENVNLAVLSHNHIDHGGDINNFCLINKKASIRVNTDLSEKLYTKVLSILKFPVGLKLDPKNRNRIIIHNKSEEIANHIHIVKLSEYANNSILNRDLYLLRNGKIEKDNFIHESALVVEENNELVVFCACSHHGVNRIINDVENTFPNLKVRTFIGGFHMCNPVTKKNESDSFIFDEILRFKNRDIIFYTGHCTGEYAYKIMKSELGAKINRLSTGLKFKI